MNDELIQRFDEYVPGCRGRGGCGCQEEEGAANGAASWPSQADSARALARRIEMSRPLYVLVGPLYVLAAV